MKVTLTPKGNHEDIVKHITVVSDDPEQPRFALTMKGKLLVDLHAEPTSVNVGSLGLGEAGVATLHLRPREGVEVTAVTLEDAEGFELRRLEPEPDGRLAYELRFAGSKTAGSFATRVRVTTDGENTPELTVPVRARVLGNLDYPIRLALRERDGAFPRRQIRISARDQRAPKIGKIVDRGGLLKVTPREPQKGAVILDVEVDADAWKALPPDQQLATHALIVHTDDPNQAELEISYTLAPAVTARPRR